MLLLRGSPDGGRGPQEAWEKEERRRRESRQKKAEKERAKKDRELVRA